MNEILDISQIYLNGRELKFLRGAAKKPVLISGSEELVKKLNRIGLVKYNGERNSSGTLKQDGMCSATDDRGKMYLVKKANDRAIVIRDVIALCIAIVAFIKSFFF